MNSLYLDIGKIRNFPGKFSSRRSFVEFFDNFIMNLERKIKELLLLMLIKSMRGSHNNQSLFSFAKHDF